MTYSAYGVSLTDGQKQSLTAAVRTGRAVTLRVSHPQFWPRSADVNSNSDQQIGRAKAARRGVDQRLSKTQLSKQGGFGPFAGSMLAGIAAPMIGKWLGFGQDGRGLQLPGTSVPRTGLGLQLPRPGTKRGRGGKKENGGILWALPHS